MLHSRLDPTTRSPHAPATIHRLAHQHYRVYLAEEGHPADFGPCLLTPCSSGVGRLPRQTCSPNHAIQASQGHLWRSHGRWQRQHSGLVSSNWKHDRSSPCGAPLSPSFQLRLNPLQRAPKREQVKISIQI